MNTEAAMELQMRLAKEALAMLVIHPTFDVQLYRESIMEIGEAWELPADATLEALALIEHERLAIQKAGEGGVVQHILPEEELPMHATGTETLDKPKLLGIFIAICTVGIIIVGYFFNAIQYLIV